MPSQADFFAAVAAWTKSLALPGVQWQGLTGYRELDGDRLLRLEIMTHGTHDSYAGIEARVLSRTHGKLDVLWFDFDAVGFQRGDTRTDHPDQCFVINGYRGGEAFSWFLAVPKSLKPMRDRIEVYAKLWTLSSSKGGV